MAKRQKGDLVHPKFHHIHQCKLHWSCCFDFGKIDIKLKLLTILTKWKWAQKKIKKFHFILAVIKFTITANRNIEYKTNGKKRNWKGWLGGGERSFQNKWFGEHHSNPCSIIKFFDKMIDLLAWWSCVMYKIDYNNFMHSIGLVVNCIA